MTHGVRLANGEGQLLLGTPDPTRADAPLVWVDANGKAPPEQRHDELLPLQAPAGDLASNATLATIIVIGCGKSKLARSARARELYTGNLFLACVRYAESRDGPWGILSALHGFLQPDQRIRPYDYRLPKRQQELAHWRINAATGLSFWRDGQRFTVECLAGEDYAAPFCEELERRGVKCTRPLRGMSIGKRLQWLSQRSNRGDGVPTGGVVP